jgi:hypothetical protein
MGLDQITVGDSFTDIEFQIVDANKVPRSITNWELRAFVEGAGGDRPGSMITSSALTTAAASDQLTRSAGSFTGEGWTEGMLILADGVPEGTFAKVVAAGAVTMSNKATKTAAGTLTAKAWFGIVCPHVDDPTGVAKLEGIGALLNLDGRLEDLYIIKVRAKVPGAPEKVGWNNETRGRVQFQGVAP